ncbi:DUF4190 domain-containing protein [Streptomyces sp. NPDC052051]|uniref:DUF4190 domain-containing protein n=1 Tax=Streptomyces sp. NPDC052051 TaxID=3154649 RepID=UPI003449357A
MNAQGTETPLDRTASAQHQAVRTSTAPKNGLATAAMILGISGLATSVVFIGGPLAVVGLILGIAALMTARRTGTGRGKAVTALVTSSLAIVLSALVAVLVVWYANKTQACYRPDSFHQYTQCVREHLN